MTSLNRSDENSLLEALRHPLRRRLLRLMAGEEAISPRALATALDRPLSNVSYHVRVLAECGAIALVNTTPVRGSVQHFYRSTVDAPWAREIIELDDPEVASSGESPDA